MKIFISLFLCFLQIAGFTQVRIILDTDIDSDVDDVEAVAMVHALADQACIGYAAIVSY